METDEFKVVVGHRFEERESQSSKRYCEKCNSVIWGVLQASFKCSGKIHYQVTLYVNSH